MQQFSHMRRVPLLPRYRNMRWLSNLRHWADLRQQPDLSRHADLRSYDNLRCRDGDVFLQSDMYGDSANLQSRCHLCRIEHMYRPADV